MAEQTPGPSMRTELDIKPVTPVGGEALPFTPGTIQNRKLLPLADLVTHNTIWLVESESNNVGSVKDPKDCANLTTYAATLRRLWDRTKKFNRGGGDTQYEVTHPIGFVAMGVIQSMPNTPARQLAYLNWHLFRTMLEKQGSTLQVFIDEAAIKDIEEGIKEIEEFVRVEFGTGEAKEGGSGLFETGELWPDFSRAGRIVPAPMGGFVQVGEPSAAAPPKVPPDSPDTR